MIVTSDIKVYDKIIVTMNKFIIEEDKVKKILKEKPPLMINVNSNNIDCILDRYSRTNNQLFLRLNRPVAIDSTDNLVTIINCDKNKNILGRGIIIKGIECERL